MANPIGEAFVRVLPDVTKFASALISGLKTEIATAEKSLTAVKVKLLLDPKAIEAIKAEVASIPTVVPVKLLVDPKAIEAIKTEISSVPTVVPIELLLDPKSAEVLRTEIFNISTVVKVRPFIDPKSIEELQLSLEAKVVPISVKAVLDPKSLELLLGELASAPAFVNVHTLAQTSGLREDIQLAASTAGGEVPVAIVPSDLPAFRALIESQVASAPVPVAIVPADLPAFRGLMEAGLATPPVPVAVLPGDLAAFRAALEAELATLPIGVPVAPLVTPGRTAPANVVSSAPQSAASLAKRQSELLGQQAVLTERFTKQNQALTGSLKSVADANKNYNATVKLSEDAIRLRVALDNEETQALERKAKALVVTADKERLAALAAGKSASTGGAGVDTSGKSKELKQIEELSKKAAAGQVLLEKGQFSGAQAAHLNLSAQTKLQEVLGGTDKAAEAAALALTGETEALVKNTAAIEGNIAVQKLIIQAEEKLANAQGIIGTTAIGKTPKQTAQRDLTVAKAADTAAEKANSAAKEQNLAIGTASTAQIVAETAARRVETQGLVTNAEAVLGATVAQQKLAREAAASAKNTALVARGAGATGLSLAGLRGATLAASGQFLAGAAAASILAKSLGTFTGFEETLNTFQVVAGATADQLKQVSERAKQLGNDITLPAVSAATAATAMTELAKAGLTVKESMAAARGSLQLATAAGISTSDAVKLVATALNSFGLKGKEATHVADLFASAANAAQGNITDFGIALEQSAAVAHQVGLSLDDTLSLLALFARNGLKGSDAGTSLRTSLIKLIAPTKTAGEVIGALGLHIRDAQGHIRPDIFAQFGVATKGLSAQTKDSLAVTIAGTDAVRAFAIGAREGAAGLGAMQQALAKQGEASIVASGRTKGLAGQTEAFKNSAATLGIQLGSGLAPAVGKLVSSATTVVTQLQGVGSGVSSVTHSIGILNPALKVLSNSFGAALVPALGAFAAFKSASGGLNLLVGVSNKYKGITPALAAATKELTAATESQLIVGAASAKIIDKQVAAELKLAAANRVAAASAAETVAATEAQTVARGLSALATTGNVLTIAALATGAAIFYLGQRESSTKKASDELKESLSKLASAATPRNLIEFRKSLEDLTLATVNAGLANASLRFQLGAGNEQEKQILNDRIRAAGVNELVKNLRKQADAIRDSQPLQAHQLDLAADFAKLIGRAPSKLDFKIITNVKKTSDDIVELLKLIAAVPGKHQFEAQQALINLDPAEIKKTQNTLKGLENKLFPEFKPIPLHFTVEGDKDSSLTSITKTLETAIKLAAIKGIKGADTKKEILSLFQQLADLGPAGRAAGFKLFKELGDGMTSGLTSTQKDQIAAAQKAVADATQAVSDAIANGQKQVTDSINSAKTNLGSLTGGLASSVSQVLDARAQKAIADLDKSALGKEIVALQNSLDKSSIVGQRASLKFSIATATDESSRRNAQLQLVQFNLQTKLSSDQKELQSKKDTIQKVENAQKESITRQLNAYANEFATGKITFEAFQNDIVKILGKHASKFGDTGKLLGTAFAAAFNAQVAAVLDQASALVGFVQKTKGGTTQFSLTHPAETLAAANRAIQEAKTARDATLQTLKDTRDAIGAKNKGGTNGLLVEIRNILEGRGTKPRSKTTTIPGGITVTTTTTQIGGKYKNP